MISLHSYLRPKNTRKALWYAIVALGLCNPLFVAGAQIAPHKQLMEEIDVNPINLADEYITAVHKTVARLNAKLIDLASMINNNQVTLPNKDQSLDAIRGYGMFLNEIENEQFIDADGHVVHDVLTIIIHFAKHLDTMLSRKSYRFEPFDLSDYQSKSSQLPITIEDIDAALQELTHRITNLECKIDSVGLEWYNKAYRKFDNYVIEPCIKYNVPYRMAGATAATFAGLTLWWIMANNSFNESRVVPDWIKNKLYGPIPRYFENTGQLRNFEELELFGKADGVMARVLLGTSPILGFLINKAGSWAASEVGKYEPKVRNAVQIFHNRMKGGIYNNVAQKLDSDFVSNVYFDDIIGSGDVVEEFKVLIEYMQNPESFDRAQLVPHKGILLYGGSRTGKTFCVTALYNEMKKRCGSDTDLKFIQLNCAVITQLGIPYVIELLKNEAPCIVFFDEIDLLALQRNGSKNDMLNEFLTCMSGALEPINPKKQIIFIAATNKAENLDFALLQHGRFGKQFLFTLPTLEQRKLQITRKLRKLSLDTTKFDVNSLAYNTEGLSYQGIGVLISRGLLKARLRKQPLAQKHLEEAINEDIRGINMHDQRLLNDRERNILAMHFAGHALALNLLELPEQLSCATINQVRAPIQETVAYNHLIDSTKKAPYEQGKVFTHMLYDTALVVSYEEQIARCKYLLAGVAAEEIFLGKSAYSCCSQDTPKAMEIAQAIALEGLDPASLPATVKEERFKKAEQIMRTCKEDIKKLLSKHRRELNATIELLKQDGIVYGITVRDLLHEKTSVQVQAA